MHTKTPINTGWRFHKGVDWSADWRDWPCGEDVTIPHTFQIEPPDVLMPYTGKCAYAKTLRLGEAYAGKKIMLEFEGVMHYAARQLLGQIRKAQQIFFGAAQNHGAQGRKPRAQQCPLQLFFYGHGFKFLSLGVNIIPHRPKKVTNIL